MIDYWILAVAGGIGIFVFLLVLILILIQRERRLFRSRVAIRACIDLFAAAAELDSAGADETRSPAAQRRIADAAERLNHALGPEVFPHTGTLIRLLAEPPGKPGREEFRETLDAIAFLVCRTFDPVTARELREALARLRP